MKFSKKIVYLPLLMMMLSYPSLAQNMVGEKIKAYYIWNISKFVKLEEKRKIRQICFYESGGDKEQSVGNETSALIKTKGDSSFVVSEYRALGDFSKCDLFYIPLEEKSNLRNILAALDNQPTLTVSSIDNFISSGGMIGFVTDDEGHIKMEANLINARKRQVEIDSQLLEIMYRVIQ